MSFPLLFVIVISVLGFTKVTVTSEFVNFSISYLISAVGVSALVMSSYKLIMAAVIKLLPSP